MRQWKAVCVTGVLAMAMLFGSACAKKTVQATGDAQETKVAKAETPPAKSTGSDMPEAPGASSKSAPLSGFESTKKGGAPSEESVGGSMVAKVAPEMQQEQAAKAMAGSDLEDVYFGFDSWKIVDQAKQSLERDATWLRAHPDKKVTIEGHCDERGTLEYNLVLGEKRAKAVKQYLSDLGVDGGRLHVTSFGKEKPFCKEHDEDCYQKNRRGHLVVRAQ